MMINELSLDLTKDQPLMSIRQDGRWIGHIGIVDGLLTTHGEVGDGNQYANFVELIFGLQGFGIELDDIFIDDELEYE